MGCGQVCSLSGLSTWTTRRLLERTGTTTAQWCVHGRGCHPAVAGRQHAGRLALRRGVFAAGVPRHPAALANRKLDVTHIVTGRVGLTGVAGAFTALAGPETHAKILIDPSIDTDAIVQVPGRYPVAARA